MRNWPTYLAFFTMLFCGSSLSGQQLWQYNQVIFNPYDANVAFAGQYNALSANLRVRAQWMGFEGAPTSAHGSLHTPLANQRLAFGLRFLQEKTGARSQGQYALSFAYKVPVGTAQFSAGLAAGLHQQSLDKQALRAVSTEPIDAIDPNQTLPLVDVGVGLASPRYFVGIQLHQLLGAAIEWDSQSTGKQRRHLQVMGSYGWQLRDKWELRPTIVYRSDALVAEVWDAQVLLGYQKQIWLGAGYRSNASVLAMAQFAVNDTWRVGYSFDTSLGDQSLTALPSHELFLGFNLATQWLEQRSSRYF